MSSFILQYFQGKKTLKYIETCWKNMKITAQTVKRAMELWKKLQPNKTIFKEIMQQNSEFFCVCFEQMVCISSFPCTFRSSSPSSPGTTFDYGTFASTSSCCETSLVGSLKQGYTLAWACRAILIPSLRFPFPQYAIQYFKAQPEPA